jgi:hypothetical protein
MPQLTRATIVALAALLVVATVAPAQRSERSPFSATRADTLLAEGRWTEAEALLYEQSQRDPRAPVPRAALGRYLGMKGAVRPAIVLIDEARQFGLDPTIARELIVPLRAILAWRTSAVELRGDSTILVQPAADRRALFRVSFPPADVRAAKGGAWFDVVDRPIGLDSVNTTSRPIGIEIFEALVPSLDVREGQLTLHANARAPLLAFGRRYQVLRSNRGVQVLVGDRRTLPLADALRELSPKWWQLDLPHGLLVVR